VLLLTAAAHADPIASSLSTSSMLDDIGAVNDEIRGIVARNWPHLLSSCHRKKIDVARGAAHRQRSSVGRSRVLRANVSCGSATTRMG